MNVKVKASQYTVYEIKCKHNQTNLSKKAELTGSIKHLHTVVEMAVNLFRYLWHYDITGSKRKH